MGWVGWERASGLVMGGLTARGSSLLNDMCSMNIACDEDEKRQSPVKMCCRWSGLVGAVNEGGTRVARW